MYSSIHDVTSLLADALICVSDRVRKPYAFLYCVPSEKSDVPEE